MAERWTGDPRPDHEESIDNQFADPGKPPAPVHRPTAHALELLI